MGEFMLKLKKSLDRDLIKGDLYPEKDKLRELQLVTPGKADWKASLELMGKLAAPCPLSDGFKDLIVPQSGSMDYWIEPFLHLSNYLSIQTKI